MHDGKGIGQIEQEFLGRTQLSGGILDRYSRTAEASICSSDPPTIAVACFCSSACSSAMGFASDGDSTDMPFFCDSLEMLSAVFSAALPSATRAPSDSSPRPTSAWGGTGCRLKYYAVRSPSAPERQVNVGLPPESGRKPKIRSGLGLFDVCPARDEGAGCTSASGQTLNKPPGTKPRNAAARFG